jgi:hypothetical protein
MKLARTCDLIAILGSKVMLYPKSYATHFAILADDVMYRRRGSAGSRLVMVARLDRCCLRDSKAVACYRP